MALIHSATEIYNALLEKISNEVREASGDDEALLKIIEKYNLFEEESNDDTYYYDSSNAKILIIGPNAHKAEGIEGYSSVVAMIKSEQNDFPLLTLAAEPSGKLKFTKTSLRKALNETRLAKLLA